MEPRLDHRLRSDRRAMIRIICEQRTWHSQPRGIHEPRSNPRPLLPAFPIATQTLVFESPCSTQPKLTCRIAPHFGNPMKGGRDRAVLKARRTGYACGPVGSSPFTHCLSRSRFASTNANTASCSAAGGFAACHRPTSVPRSTSAESSVRR